MLKWSVICLFIALVAARLGYSEIAEGADSIIKPIFYIFLVLMVISFVHGLTIYKKLQG